MLFRNNEKEVREFIGKTPDKNGGLPWVPVTIGSVNGEEVQVLEQESADKWAKIYRGIAEDKFLTVKPLAERHISEREAKNAALIGFVGGAFLYALPELPKIIDTIGRIAQVIR